MTSNSIFLKGNYTEPVKKRPKCFTLIGMPGVGKTSWVEGYSREGDAVVIGIDRSIERISWRLNSSGPATEFTTLSEIISHSRSYSEMFSLLKYNADLHSHAMTISLKGTNQDVIIDSTNITLLKRKRIREDFFPKSEYDHYAVFFGSPSWDEIVAINNERRASLRDISTDVLAKMHEVFKAETENFLNSEEVKEYVEVLIPSFHNNATCGELFD